MAKASQVLGLSQLPILVLFLWCCSQSQVAISLSKVQFLPGFQGPLPFELETGYVGVGESDEVQLFYYFVKSKKNPQKDPLLLWLTGGPGCSAWSGFAYEIGPLKYKVEQYNGSLPTLLLNPNSWTKISNIIFVDSPVGTGFSYARTSFASHSGDFKQVNHLHQFIKKWLIDHPEFTSNPVYISGDSYSGIPLPILVQQICNGNNEGILPFINLQGYLLGNPATGPSYLNSRIPYAHRMGLISDELYESLEKSCGGEYQQIDPNSTDCLKFFQVYEECTSRICMAHILEPDCPFASSKPEDNQRRLLTQDSELLLNSDFLLPPFGCREYEQLLSTYWANDPYVRNALHIRKGSIEKWQRCNYDLPYEKDAPSSVEYLVNLSARGYRSLVYSGDHDFIVPFIDTQKWIRSLNYSIVDDWRPWFVQDQIAGYTRTYSNYMTFATVKGGGHTAPQYKPKECLAMLEKWLNQEPL